MKQQTSKGPSDLFAVVPQTELFFSSPLFSFPSTMRFIINLFFHKFLSDPGH